MLEKLGGERRAGRRGYSPAQWSGARRRNRIASIAGALADKARRVRRPHPRRCLRLPLIYVRRVSFLMSP